MVSERQDQAMADGTRMEVVEEIWRKTDNRLQQFIAVTREAFQDEAKHRAETDLKIDALTELIKKFITRSGQSLFLASHDEEQSPLLANHGEVAEAGLEKSARVEGQEFQISATEGSDQWRIPNPRTGSAGADDPTNLRENDEDVDAVEIQEINEKSDKLQTQFSKVTFDFPNNSKTVAGSQKTFEEDERGCVNHMKFDGMEKGRTGCAMNSIEILGIPSAYKVFVKLLVKKTCVVECVDVSISSVKAKTAYQVFDGMGRLVSTAIFDPGGSLDVLNGENGVGKVIDMVSIDLVGYNLSTDALFSLQCIKGRLNLMPFYRGRVAVILVGLGGVGVTSYMGRSLSMVFDPGGMCELWIIFPSMRVFMVRRNADFWAVWDKC